MSRLLLFISVLVSLNSSFAFTLQQVGAVEEETVETTFKPRTQIATIVYMGLAGAVLGLSTLSFYGRPQDRLTNIAVGFGAGVVIGAVYMTYKVATEPASLYQPQYEYEETRARESHHWILGAQEVTPRWTYRWDF